MQVSKNLAKWAYAWNYAVDRKPYYHERIGLRWDDRKHCYPEHISLCPLFWRTFVLTPAMILTGLGIGTAALIGVRDFIGPIAIAAGAVTGAFGLAWLVSRIIPDSLVKWVGDTTYAAASYIDPIFKGASKAKKTLCPLFDVKE